MSFGTVAIAADHAGFEMKDALGADVSVMGYSVLDLGTGGPDSVDYPDFAKLLVKALEDGAADVGVLVCGSGIGMSIAANRHKSIRAALCFDAEAARLARQHNDANVVCFGGRMIGPEVALDCLKIFLQTEFEGGRHARRVNKLSNPQ